MSSTTEKPSDSSESTLKDQSNETEELKLRLDSLMALAKENLDELRVKLLALLEENAALKLQLESSQTDDLFQIDTVPCPDLVDGDSPRDENDVMYETRIGRTVLGNANSEDDEVPSSKEENIVKNTCFNCSGDHQLPDCTEPRDHRKIAQNRREFMANSVRSARYHIDENQRFGQFQPGLPSAQLREALGLQDDQLPSYIYRMRELGHPPGWLKAAEINHSGLGIYVQKDQKIPEASEEDGEISEACDKVQYDFEKLPEWPGFNVEPPENFREESRRFNVPQMQSDQLKSSLLAKLKPKAQKGYVRKEMQPTTNGSTSKKAKVVGSDDDAVVADDENSLTGTPRPDITPLRGEIEVLSVDHGTPICTLYSPYSSLPAQPKWATNTTDHIMFENLPESTGKYENIRGILQKIREKSKLDFDSMDD